MRLIFQQCMAAKSKAGVLQPLYCMDLDGLGTIDVAPVLVGAWLAGIQAGSVQRGVAI